MFEVCTPVFGVPGVGVDEVLLSAERLWITCDEFAAGTAAIAYYMLAGHPARVVAMAGPGADLLAPALAMAERENAVLIVEQGRGATARMKPVRRPDYRCGHGYEGGGAPVVVLSLSDVAANPTSLAHVRRVGLPVVTEHPALPGGAWFPQQWLGHLGYLGHVRAAHAVRTRPVVRLTDLVGMADGRPEAIVDVKPPGDELPEEAIAWDLDAALPPEAPILCDAGAAHTAVARTIAWRGRRPVGATNGFTTMGWSLGATLGAHVALPGMPIGVMIGDGSLLMRLGDLAVLSRYEVPAVIVVLLNGVLGSDRGHLPPPQRQRIAELPEVDWSGVMRALGVGVSQDIAEAASRSTSGPQVVLVDTDDAVPGAGREAQGVA